MVNYLVRGWINVFMLSCLFCLMMVSGSSSIDISDVDLADTAHQVIQPAVSSIESGFSVGDTNSAVDYTTALSVIKAITTPDIATALSNVAAAYRTVNPAFSLQVTTADSGSTAKKQYLSTGLYDLAVTPSSPTPADFRTMPNLQYFPIVSMGVVAAYHLPISFTNGFDLQLTGLILCQIHAGNISSWNDPAIMALNPRFSWGQVDSTKLIQVILPATTTTPHLVFSTYCNKIDPEFAAVIPPSSLPTYLATSQIRVGDASRAGDRVAETPWALAITNVPRAQSIPISFANLIPSSGKALNGDSASIALGVINVASLAHTFIGETIDLSNPNNPQAWPMSMFQYVYMDGQNTRTSCRTKRILLEFLLWIYSNDIPQAIFDESYIVPIPSILVERFNVLEYLRSTITCDNAALVATNAATLFVSADPSIEGLIRIYSHFYSSVDTDYAFKTRRLTESLSLERLRLNEAAFALVRTGLIDDEDINVIQKYGFVTIPTLMVGVVPIFSLPDVIVSLAGNVSTVVELGLPPLYPLALDLETMGRIFMGNVSSWLDPDLVTLNPQLAAWFNETQADDSLHVIVGGSSALDTSTMAKVIFKAISVSNICRDPRYQRIFANGANNAVWKSSFNPFGLLLDVTYVDTSIPTNIEILDFESRLSVRTAETPGSISYRAIGTQGIGVSDPTTEFRIIQTPITMTQTEMVEANIENVNACATFHTDIAATMAGSNSGVRKIGTSYLLSLDLQRHWVNPVNPPQGCWPISVLVSTIVPMQYASNKSGASTTDSTAIGSQADACVLAQHGLEFSNYIQSTNALTLPAEQLGIVRLASIPVVSELSRSVLYATTCDGLPVLVTTPSYFTISPAISQFGMAIGALGLVTIAISLVLVIVFRHHIIIRSSSAPFLVLILFGLGLLFVSLITWSIGPSPTYVSCGAFVWFSQIGFMMVYVPLFAKTYRVWRIFSGSHLKVVKISNRRLLSMSVIAMVIDILVLTIWQSVSPIQPIQYTRQLSDHWDYYTHCSVQKPGLPFVIIEAVYKAGILLFGALMAFSTRNVKATFNESTQIAWSIYNTLLAAIIVAIMITFLNAIESTLIIMVQILLLWMPLCTWALLFIPKFQLLLGKSEHDVIEASRSELLPQEKSNGFSFASVAFMSQNQLRSYYDALKTQVAKVQQRLGVTVTKFEATPGMVTLEGGSLLSNGGKNVSGNNSRNNSKNSLLSDQPTPTNTNKNISTGGSAHFNSFATTKLPTSALSKGSTVRPVERSVTPTSSIAPISTLTSTSTYPSSAMKVNKEPATISAARAGIYMTNQSAEQTVLNGNESAHIPSPTITSTGTRNQFVQRYHGVLKNRTGGSPGPSQHHRSIDVSPVLNGRELPTSPTSPESTCTLLLMPGATQPAVFPGAVVDPVITDLIAPNRRQSDQSSSESSQVLVSETHLYGGAETPISTPQQPLGLYPSASDVIPLSGPVATTTNSQN